MKTKKLTAEITDRKRNLLMHQIVNIILVRTAVTDMRCTITLSKDRCGKAGMIIIVKDGDTIVFSNMYDTLKRMRKEVLETYIDEIVTDYYKRKEYEQFKDLPY